MSSEHGCTSNVRTLLEHGANLTSRDSNGMTALDLAETGDHSECMHLLKEAAGECYFFYCNSREGHPSILFVFTWKQFTVTC